MRQRVMRYTHVVIQLRFLVDDHYRRGVHDTQRGPLNEGRRLRGARRLNSGWQNLPIRVR